MKKTLIVTLALAIVLVSSIAVFATEDLTEDSKVSNMDVSTFLETRLQRIDEVLEEGKITEEQAAELKEHITEIAENGEFGQRYAGAKNTDECILGEEGGLGLFRGENSGMRQGKGNGIKSQNMDGSAAQEGFTGNQRGQRRGNRLSGNCIQN